MYWDTWMHGALWGDYFGYHAYKHTWEYWHREEGWTAFSGYHSLSVDLGNVLLMRRGRIQVCRRFAEVLKLVEGHIHPPEVTWAVARLRINTSGIPRIRRDE